MISFTTDWFDLAVQETLKSLLQHHNSKASVLWCSAFFMVQLSHLSVTIEKNHSFFINIYIFIYIYTHISKDNRYIIKYI